VKKRIISLVLAVCLVLIATVPALGAMSLSNFDRIRTYRGEFSDLSADAWYYDGVVSAFERGIISGKSANIFDPSGHLTIAETISLAAMLHKGYHTGSMDFPAGSPWYAPFLEYALNNGIPAGAYRRMGAAATRSDFAVLVAGALPDEALTPKNRIPDGAIPDVFESYSYGQAVYRLYRAGVVSGADGEGRFLPGRTLTRAEAAVLISRVADANSRVAFSLAAEMTAEQVYRHASPAVFFVQVKDSDGVVIKTGSGFFISESGLAITNYHVVIGATNVQITTDDGEVYDVVGIYDFNWKKDSALIQIAGDGFPYLELADSSLLQTGATVYTLGSPLGLQASFTKGIVSQALREVEGAEYIQLDAPISSGSSGGALLDSFGRVVGVTCATMTASQNINLAVPINFYAELNRDAYVPLSSIIISAQHYERFYPAPDFGAFFDVSVFRSEPSRGGTSFSYRLSDLPGDPDEIIDEYMHLIEQRFFVHTSNLTSGDNVFRIYFNSQHGVMLTIGKETVRGQECFTVTVS
jgi:hypothetical protein